MTPKTSGYAKLEETIKQLKDSSYEMPNVNGFCNEELRVNNMGNVYIVDASREKNSVSSEKIKKLIASRR